MTFQILLCNRIFYSFIIHQDNLLFKFISKHFVRFNNILNIYTFSNNCNCSTKGLLQNSFWFGWVQFTPLTPITWTKQSSHRLATQCCRLSLIWAARTRPLNRHPSCRRLLWAECRQLQRPSPECACRRCTSAPYCCSSRCSSHPPVPLPLRPRGMWSVRKCAHSDYQL